MFLIQSESHHRNKFGLNSSEYTVARAHTNNYSYHSQFSSQIIRNPMSLILKRNRNIFKIKILYKFGENPSMNEVARARKRIFTCPAQVERNFVSTQPLL